MRIKRIGAVTSGLALVASGTVFLLHTLLPKIQILLYSARFWPVVLIALGVEILIHAVRRKPDDLYRYDFASVIMMLLCIGFAFFCELARQAMLVHIAF